MPFAQNVAAGSDAAPPPGWRVLASARPQAGNNDGLFAKIYARTTPAPPGEPKYIVAFRGTNLDDPDTIGADVDIAFLRVPRQYWQALAFVQRVCKENGINPAEMHFTGHSLGGYLARTVGTTLGARHIWTFNAPGPSRRIAQRLEREIPGVSKPPGDGLVQVRTASDLVSVWGYDQGITISLDMRGRPHNLDNLAAAIEQTVEGKTLTPVRTPPKDSLSAVFDAVSGGIARSKTAGRLVKKIVDNAVFSPPQKGL
ncbi:MAG: hypothetical protein KGL10_06465 [Alphaproteobacteria bacterium]|nr:hypothetical protein [Alphaproteobacteria bacterium]MDE2336935.1 hypothetical protein [Alphaproteobacteria bacterium]